MLEHLNQLDSFDRRVDVKVIMATNKIRNIEFPLPDMKMKWDIFKLHTACRGRQPR